MKVVGVQILLHTIEYLIWLPVIASVCSTTPGALMFPVEVQNAARMMHEVGPSLTTAGRRRKHPCIKRCLHTQGRLGENKWRTISCHTSKCRIRAESRAERQATFGCKQPSPRTSKLSFGHLLLPPKCAQELFYSGNYLEQPPKHPTHSCIV